MFPKWTVFLIMMFIIPGLYQGARAQEKTEQAKITTEDVQHAERLVGLEFTDAERDSMLPDLLDLRKNYTKLWSVPLDNRIMPALQFNPLPQGFEFNREKQPFRFSNPVNVKMPANSAELAFYSIPQLAALVKSGQISSEELTNIFLARLRKYGPKLECVITLTEQRAIEQARKMDAELAAGKYRGVLHGIPFGVKDLLATRDYPTTWGAMPYKDQMIDRDAVVVSRLEEAGAVLVAKLTMGALAWGDVWFGGKTRNPWNPEQGSSGSSAGSAAATSAGLVPFAIGTETWGSIVSPATRCGVTGLRPTYGRVSRSGAMALSWSMDKIGPICRSVEDCAIVFNAIYGPDGQDPTLYDAPFNYSPDVELSSLKIGYLKRAFEQDSSHRAQNEAVLEVFRSVGVNLIPVDLPDDLPVYDIAFILSAEAAAAFDELTRSNRDDLLVRQIRNAWPNVFRQARFIPAVEYINANRVRTLWIERMEELMQQVDVYIAPSFGTNLLLTNLTGHPCVVVPSGFDEKGSPTSISFIGKLFDEAGLLQVAKFYQDATGHHLKHPTL